MGFFESLFYVIWRGIAIGILISAPMGPVGILCIQRTLYKGRKTGLYTGVGAAISDLFYCILTGFGLSFIEEFLERNQNIIQLAGSVVLIAFAIYLFKKNPASSLKTPQNEVEQISHHKNILGGFLFTFSNPLILFLIIGLFARFNFSIPEINFYYYIAGYVAIFVGAVIWWEFVTFSVNKLRAHFNLRSMWLINRIIGVIILLFAIVGIVTGITNQIKAENFHWNQGRGYLPYNYSTSEGIFIDNISDTLQYTTFYLPRPSENLLLNFRSKNFHGHPGKKYPYFDKEGVESRTSHPHWGFYLITPTNTLVVSLKTGEKRELIESVPSLDMEVLYIDPSVAEQINASEKTKSKKFQICDGIDPFEGENLWWLSKDGDRVKIYCGNKSRGMVGEFTCKEEIEGIGFFAGWGAKILISDINLEADNDPGNEVVSVNLDNLDEYLSSSEDMMEGYWTLFDRELEENLLKMGGNYRLACIKDGDDYVMIYMGGAEINSKAWEKGDLKCRLHPTDFSGIYDVEWYDALKDVLKKDIKAQQGGGNTLQIQFPYQSSKLRLRKIPD